MPKPPEHTLDLAFDFPCPPQALFAAWTEPAEITRWWGEDGVYRTTGWLADLKTGGAWRAEFEGDGEAFSAEGRYLAVDAPARLVWTWRASWEPERETFIDMGFAATPTGSRLDLRQSGFATAEERDDGETGWRQVAGWLTLHFA